MARARRFVQKGSKRLTEWSQLAAQGFVTVADTVAVLVSSVSFESPGTIVRARGNISLFSTDAASDESMTGAFGVGLVSAEALAVGITAIPEPFTDADWGGWMVWQSFAVRYEAPASGDFGALRASWSWQIDLKAMRKVEPNSAMVFVVESEGGAFAFAEQVRLLLMLH